MLLVGTGGIGGLDTEDLRRYIKVSGMFGFTGYDFEQIW